MAAPTNLSTFNSKPLNKIVFNDPAIVISEITSIERGIARGVDRGVGRGV